MGFPLCCQYRRNALLLICVTQPQTSANQKLGICHLLLTVSSWGGSRFSWAETDEWNRERDKQGKEKCQGRKRQERKKEEKSSTQVVQLRCFHQSDPVRCKTNQCGQLSCCDWQQLHWSQMEMELQCYPFIYCFCFCWTMYHYSPISFFEWYDTSKLYHPYYRPDSDSYMKLA